MLLHFLLDFWYAFILYDILNVHYDIELYSNACLLRVFDPIFKFFVTLVWRIKARLRSSFIVLNANICSFLCKSVEFRIHKFYFLLDKLWLTPIRWKMIHGVDLNLVGIKLIEMVFSPDNLVGFSVSSNARILNSKPI